MNRFLSRTARTLICLACFTLPAWGGPKSASRVDSHAQWQAGTSFIAEVHEACAKVPYPKFQDCYFDQMQRSGASPQAVAFSQQLVKEDPGLMGFMRDFRNAGRVDVAYVVCPFRANENDVWLLINGSPPIIDVDNLSRLPQDQLAENPTYMNIAKEYPNVDLWPGDRAGTKDLAVSKRSGGGQRFVVSYYLQNGCHACARVGSAAFAFDFDSTGKFLGASLLEVKASLPASH